MRAGAFGTYNNKKTIITDNQSTNDIIKAIQKHHKLYKPEYDKASQHFWKGSAADTAYDLYKFLKNNIEYQEEPKDEQTIKSPAALLHQGHGDCKHYASFVAGVVDSLKRKGYPIDVLYRYAAYKPGVEPHHVFAVVLDENGKEYWVDPIPTIPGFNHRRQPTSYRDKSAGMAGIGTLYSISGMDGIGRKNPGKKAEKKKKRQARKAEGKGIFRKAAQGIKKVSFAVNRNAMLLMLKMNLFRLATKIHAKIKDPANKAKLAKKWKQLGGNPEQLFKDIARGVKVWNKRHKNKQVSGTDNVNDEMYGLNKYGWAYDAVFLDDVGFCVDCTNRNGINKIGYIGVAPAVGAGAIIVAAMPVVAALASLLKGMGIDTGNIKKDAVESEEQMYQEEAAEEQEPAPQSQSNAMPTPGTEDVYSGSEADSYYEDPADMEDEMGAVTAEDMENTGRAAKGLATLFKRDPRKVAARQKKRLQKKRGPVTKKTAPRKIKVVQKAIPLSARTLPGGQVLVKQGRPAWDQAVTNSHEGGPKGLQVNQGPEGGQGFSDWVNSAQEWVMNNKGTAAAAAAGLLLISGVIPLGKKRRR